MATLNRRRGSLKALLIRLENLVIHEKVTWAKIKINTKLKTLEKVSANTDSLRIDSYTIAPVDHEKTEIDSSLRAS